jgi:hypothetical protein
MIVKEIESWPKKPNNNLTQKTHSK